MAKPIPDFLRRIRRWHPVLANVNSFRQSSARLTHWETAVAARAPIGATARGHVLWGTAIDEVQVGLAWQWVCLGGRVVVVADPMAVVTNLALVDDESGHPLSATAAAVCLNDIIWELPWRECVLAQIRA